MAELDAEDLNTLYDAAMEFGANWRRPVADLAAERLPDADPGYRAELVEAVERCRAEIEDHVASVFTLDDTAGAAMAAAAAWISARYPWMTPANVDHGVSQGGYYAWHG